MKPSLLSSSAPLSPAPPSAAPVLTGRGGESIRSSSGLVDGSASATRTAIKSPKAASAAECATLEQLPNIGPSLAADLRLIGIHAPADLRGKDAFVLYQKLCGATGARQDPCVLDTFMAVTDFMRGAPAAPWWHYTAQRKALFGAV